MNVYNTFRHLLRVVTFVFMAILAMSCRHQTTESLELRTVYFDKEILPIFQTNCTASGCHGGGGDGHGLVLNAYSGIMQHVSPGSPEKSEVYSAITSKWANAMPPTNPLSAQQVTLIRLWILQGAKNNTAPDTVTVIPPDTVVAETKGYACFTRDVQPIIAANCVTCHSNFSDYAGIMEVVSSGNPGKSEMYRSITSTDIEERMPQAPASKLLKSQIDTIYSWIKRGAKNETCVNTCDPQQFNFAADIAPVIELSCRSCHSGASANKGIRLEDYATISAVAKSGKLVKVLHGTKPYPLMPPPSALSSCNIEKIENWVNAGATNN